jgi:hypothetical protein
MPGSRRFHALSEPHTGRAAGRLLATTQGCRPHLRPPSTGGSGRCNQRGAELSGIAGDGFDRRPEPRLSNRPGAPCSSRPGLGDPDDRGQRGEAGGDQAGVRVGRGRHVDRAQFELNAVGRVQRRPHAPREGARRASTAPRPLRRVGRAGTFN